MEFEAPPLIELIAEFRWLPTNALGEPVTTDFALGRSGPRTEAFYESVRSTLARAGFNASERIIPVDFIHPPYQAVVRYRRSDDQDLPVIFQVGVGLFSVHALPPYKNWEAFRPKVELGINALMQARGADPLSVPTAFTGISLRYINAFGPELMGGKSKGQFASEVLGVKVALPPSIATQIPNSQSVEVGLSISAPTGDGLTLGLGIGSNSKLPHSLIVDISSATKNQVGWDASRAIGVLDSAHDSIRKSFVGMTESLHQQMKPVRMQ